MYQTSQYYDAGLYGLEQIEQSIQALLKQADYLLADEKSALIDSCFFAAKAHEGQRRQSGEPYICHPIKVAEILANEAYFNLPVLQAAVLHDVIEDTPVEKAALSALFGTEVADLVDGVSKLEKDKNVSPKEHQAKTFVKLVHAMQADPRVVMIKFADRLHNIQTLGALRIDKRRRIAQETLDVYVPIASRLGMFIFKNELEEEAFLQVHPWRYRVVKRLLNENPNRLARAKAIIETLNARFESLNISASIRHRRRNVYTMYQKMKNWKGKRRPLSSVSIPFVIIADNIDDCYRILGIIHQTYQPILGKLKDYIASPKANGYRSLHTAVLTPERQAIQFQIRTKAMHTVAESGIVALIRQQNERAQSEEVLLPRVSLNHDNDYGNVALLPTDMSMRRWLSNLKDLTELAEGSLEFYETVKRDLTGFGMQVFTPRGEPIELPAGASVIDFAYYIHSEIGNHLSGAKVNNVETSIYYPLENGQTVELFTDESVNPTGRWLKHVKTARARTAIRHYLRSLSDDALLERGLFEIKNYLARHQIHYQSLESMLEAVAKKWDLSQALLLKRIALSDIRRGDVLKALQQIMQEDGAENTLYITLHNQQGALSPVIEAISRLGGNIVSINFLKNSEEKAQLAIVLSIQEGEGIKQLIKTLQNQTAVEQVSFEAVMI